MTASAASPNGHRLLAVIAPGAGPHLIGPPAASHWTTRPARSRVSLADELANCLTTLEEDPERFQCAAARWHALWCIDLETLTLTESSDGADGAPGARRAPGPEAAGVLRYLCLLHGQRETPEVLERWIARREGGRGVGHVIGPRRQRRPRRRTSPSTVALLCSASRAAKTSVTTLVRERRRSSLSRSRLAPSSAR